MLAYREAALQKDQGQAEQFTQAVRAHRDAMFRLARGMLRNDWDAQDAVSEAIGKAWRAYGNLRDPDRSRPWLLRICYRCCLQIQGKRREEPQAPERMELLAGGAPEETPMWMYLDMLPMKARLVMQLRYQEGLPIDEIARVLHLPRGTVSARLSRAVQQLRQIITKEEQAHG